MNTNPFEWMAARLAIFRTGRPTRACCGGQLCSPYVWSVITAQRLLAVKTPASWPSHPVTIWPTLVIRTALHATFGCMGPTPTLCFSDEIRHEHSHSHSTHSLEHARTRHRAANRGPHARTCRRAAR